MKAAPLTTSNPHVRLIEPDVERDAPLGVAWLAGDAGRETLRLMGVTDVDNKPSNLAAERRRVEDFINKPGQLNWMIQLGDTVVGSIWVDLEKSKYVESPSVHLMVGDPDARGQGAGKASIQAIIAYLKNEGNAVVYSRHTTENSASAGLLKSLGFTTDGETYTDADDLKWQNVVLQVD